MIDNKYYKELANLVELSDEEIQAYINSYKLGNSQALNKIVESHLRLAVHYANQYQNLIADSKIFELSDLISEANIGLIEAAMSYDPNQNVKFSYWSSFHIKKQIFKFIIININHIRSPYQLMQSDLKIRKKQNEMMQKLCQEIVKEEMELLGEFTQNEIEHYFRAGTQFIPDGFDLMEAEQQEDDQEEMIARIKIGLNHLNEKQRFIIINSFGIDCQQLTYEQIGKELGITKARVGQIKKKALKKLNELLK